MKISLLYDQKCFVFGTRQNIQLIPMGYDIRFIARIENNSDKDIEIEDPRTSQEVLIHVKSEKDSNETTFLLNPSMVDNQGEITAPPKKLMTLKKSQTIDVAINLFTYIMDKCFIPGRYSAAFSYRQEKSPSINFDITFTKESIGTLLDILNNPKADMWVRKESYRWLKKIKPDFSFNFNENRIESFNYWWKDNKDNRGIDSIFTDINK